MTKKIVAHHKHVIIPYHSDAIVYVYGTGMAVRISGLM